MFNILADVVCWVLPIVWWLLCQGSSTALQKWLSAFWVPKTVYIHAQSCNPLLTQLLSDRAACLLHAEHEFLLYSSTCIVLHLRQLPHVRVSQAVQQVWLARP